MVARPAEDAAEYVQRLRSLPVEQVIGEVVFGLLNAAQVKLGRRDARLLIDLATVAHEHARPYLPGELTQRIDQVLGQLRLGQVSAEGHPSPRASRRRMISTGYRRRHQQAPRGHPPARRPASCGFLGADRIRAAHRDPRPSSPITCAKIAG